MESDPEVVDAIVTALVRLRASFGDAQACREIAVRCWDPGAARVPFECWLASADRQQVLAAAQSAPPVLRALALNHLIAGHETSQTVLVRVPPPPAPALAGERQNAGRAASTTPFGLAQRAPAAQFDPAIREALLRAAATALSTEITATPSARSPISYATAQMLRDALWEISERRMAIALKYADTISPLGSRYSASYDLASKDRAAYVAYRRPRQLGWAVVLAMLASALLTAPAFRTAAPYAIGAVVLWSVSTVFETDVRELPPAPLTFLTASFLAFITAGIVCAATSFLRIPFMVRAFLAFAGSGVLALLVCGFARALRIFPVGSEGWELIFDPLTSAVLASSSALVLLLLGFVQHRLLRRAS